MKKIFTLYIVVMLMVLTMSSVNAFSLEQTVKDLSVKEIRVGLKSLASNKLTMNLVGKYKINNNIVENQTITISIKNNKLILNNRVESVIDIRPQTRGSNIYMKYKKKEHYFNGRFIVRPSKGEVLPINIISLEDYIKGVLPYEMSSGYPVEALKAQAVSARNYGVTSVNKHRNEKFDVCDSIHCQVYKGIYKDCSKIKSAVKETNGEILMDGNKVVKAFFYSSNGGYTESSKNLWNSEHDYLISQRDEFDSDSWEEKLSSKEIDTILKRKRYLRKGERFIAINNTKKGENNRVQSINITYKNSQGNVLYKSINGEGTRTALSLKSNYYNIEYLSNSDIYKISGRGFGHGVGLSQIGAKNRALNGHSYRDILGFYYKGSVIKKTP